MTSITLIDNLKASPYIQIIHIDAEVDGQAWQLLKNRADKDWSLVDCSSFLVMQELGITEALTADHHHCGHLSYLATRLALLRRAAWHVNRHIERDILLWPLNQY